MVWAEIKLPDPETLGWRAAAEAMGRAAHADLDSPAARRSLSYRISRG